LPGACRDLAGFRGSTEAELGAWLRQILAHVVAHEVRKYRGTQKRDVAQEQSLDRSLEASPQRLAQLLPDPGPSPSQQAIGREHAIILAEVLERLPGDYREIIILRNLEGLSYEEAAERMGRSAGAVRMLWVRALGRLRQELGP
jgi:RNA polymerase sigma-70 factor, ECF subfamily